ncbi:MAG: alanine--tRNA ligase [Dehalococcoidia bacterium]|nr:alanine--tRNA ligase [Dehalococcoidia bacterium]
MNSNEIREAFLKFFAEKKHKIISSSSLIPHGDPTLLLTTAGMVQVKPYFLGQAVPPAPRLASCQKCFRTTDVDAVGDSKHLTFFEMLGNFSVGDYFKEDAIKWGWEFVTKRLRLPAEKLWITVYLDDDEAHFIWRQIGIPSNRIVRMGEKENFWGPAGDSGPCGPCSEIHYDFGKDAGCGRPECDPSCSCSRFSEIWNLVFMQFDQAKNGKRTLLPRPNIDTGMGLERIVAVCNGNSSVYSTDLFTPLLEKICRIASVREGKDEVIDRMIKVIAEHSRGVTFLIADGLLPSNEGRGYVLRRILRRACFMGRKLGLNEPFMGDMAGMVIERMGTIYPELVANRKLILDVIRNEEGRFNDTLDAGINLCEKAIADAKEQNRTCLMNEDVFKFWDTYGFPLELSVEIAREHGISVDMEGFEAEMEKQRVKARSTHKFGGGKDEQDIFTRLGQTLEITEFVGYEKLSDQARILQIIDEKTAAYVEKAKESGDITLILDKTPFYGEMGGQVGDTGSVVSPSGEFRVNNSVSYSGGGIALSGRIKKGTVSVGDLVQASVDEERRKDIARNHTATHILQAALRKVLGSHVAQRGSLVTPERLRFDFTHLSPISKEELKEVQSLVNSIVRRNLPVSTDVCSYDQAISQGATAIFEEKYGDMVRLVKIGKPAQSAELCGGTHVKATGEIGYFLITGESSVGTGLRRIEAVTGRKAEDMIGQRLDALDQLASSLKVSPLEVPARVADIQVGLKASAKDKEMQQRMRLKFEITELLEKNLKRIAGINVVYTEVTSAPMPAVMEMGDMLKAGMGSGLAVLASVYENKPFFIATATTDVVSKGVHCGKLIKKVAAVAGGSGGGKADMAQAGARDSAKIGEALNAVPAAVEELLKAGHA